MTECPDVGARRLRDPEFSGHAENCVPCEVFGHIAHSLQNPAEADGCDDALARMALLQAGGLDATDRRELETHLLECGACSATLWTELADLPPGDLEHRPEQLHFRPPALVEAYPTHPRRAQVLWGSAAAAALAAAAFWAGKHSAVVEPTLARDESQRDETPSPEPPEAASAPEAPAGGPSAPSTSPLRSSLLAEYERGCPAKRRRESVPMGGSISFSCVDAKEELHGLFVAWNGDGTLQRRGYHHGVPDGKWSSWSSDGTEDMRARFRRGRLLEVEGGTVKSDFQERAAKRAVVLFERALEGERQRRKARKGTGSGERPSATAPPERLSRSDISRGIGEVKDRVNACTRHLEEEARATVVVRIAIAPSGKIKETSASGGDAVLRDCVQRAVKRARFPRTQKGMTVSYPFVLR